MSLREDVRNVAIIAHVDHGKTSLVNELLKYSDTLDSHTELSDRAMDRMDLEKERGITILAKNTGVVYKGNRINILDTPGHADFGGEVERILRMVDGVVLVVDAFEGAMPQTHFVLQKALEVGLRPLVVVNKIDRPGARPAEVVDEVLELLIDLGIDDSGLDFPVVYTSALNGTSSTSDDPADQVEGMDAVFDAILSYIPAPEDKSDEPLQFQVSLLDYNEYVGRVGIGRVFRGKIKVGDNVTVLKADGSKQNFRVTKLFGFIGLDRVETEEAQAGDIIAISGMEDISVGETIADPEHPEALPLLHIDEPTLQMTFSTNNSPFAGREGTYMTSRILHDRLKQELHTDVSLRVEPTDSSDAFIVSGRGELHLSILIENIRREGYEFQVSRPKVIYKEIDGVMMEPFEKAQVDIPNEYLGSIMEAFGERKAEMADMASLDNGYTRIIFIVPTRGLIGFTTEFMTLTRGYGMMSHTFDEYRPVISGLVSGRRNGALVALEAGTVTTYSILHLEDRGTIFVQPGTEVYGGMVIGENSRENDLTVNITRAKAMTNVRSATKDQTQIIREPRKMTLEECLQFINDDELCEITPETIRIRKKELDHTIRERQARRAKIDK